MLEIGFSSFFLSFCFHSKQSGTALNGTTGLVVFTCNAVANESLAASNSFIDSRTLPKLYLQEGLFVHVSNHSIETSIAVHVSVREWWRVK